MLYRRKSLPTLSFKKILMPLLILVLAVGFYLLINSSLFTIKNVSLEKHNVNCATDLEIKQAYPILGQSFLFLDTKKLAGDLKNKFICIKSVAVDKEFPDKIKLNISGREVKVLLVPLPNKEATTSSNLENIATPSAQDYSDIFLADDEGIVFSKGNPGINLIKVFLFEKSINLGDGLKEIIISTIKILDKVKIFGIDIRSGKIISNEILITDTKPLLIFKLNKETDIQLASLQLILQQAKMDSNTLEFIDLRFDKPIVRFAPKKK